MTNQPVLQDEAKEIIKKLGLKFIEFAGKGAFKETYKTSDSSDKYLAFKLIDFKKFNPLRTKREIEALKKCDTSLICKLFEFGKIQLANGGWFYYSIEEYLDGGTLSTKIDGKILQKEIVKQYCVDLTKALSHLDKNKLVHRDIKPDNIMFRSNENIPVLVDLGIVRDLSSTSLTLSWIPRGPGTPYYSSPEQLNNDKNLIDWRSDQFSLGLVLGTCLFGRHPFKETNMNPNQTVELMAQRGKCSESFVNSIENIGFNFLLKMMAPWPIQRYFRPEDLIKELKG